jgi:hypothetical protein
MSEHPEAAEAGHHGDDDKREEGNALQKTRTHAIPVVFIPVAMVTLERFLLKNQML